ncbi:FHA domain-containing protein, partial [Sphingomonas bacterium]|uniref:FHA domain-containing protein n=1 Tax=Sphingomonas bacterium TaxID=1895847 RepID=UPI001576E19F
MLRLRLFRKDHPGQQIDSRPLDEGEIVIGRDAKCDWPIADPERGISRRHLTVANRGGLVTLRDTSSNGVFVGDRRERVQQDRAVPIDRGEAIRFGGYLMLLEEDRREAAVAAPAASPFDGPADR